MSFVSPEYFTLMQIRESKITLTENEFLKNIFKPAKTLHEWDPKRFKSPFELSYFADNEEKQKAL